MTVLVDTIDLAASFVVRLVDDLTDRPPAPLPRCGLSVERDGEFTPTQAPPGSTAGGLVTFPTVGFPNHGSEHYQVDVEPGDLRPFLWTAPHRFVLDPVPIGNDPPPPALLEIELLPGPSYQFPSHLRVVRGLVTRDGRPAVDVLVQASVPDAARQDRSLTDGRGAFGLAVRWFDPADQLVIVVRAEDDVQSEVVLDPSTAFSTPISIVL